jgi:hypothetical protein
METQMIEDAIRYPGRSDEAAKTVGIGGLLTLFGFLLVPVVAVAGYLVRVLRTTLDGDEEPPAFDDWEPLLVDGLKATAITLAYFAVPLVVTLFATLSVLIFVPASFAVSGSEVGAADAAVRTGLGLGVLLLIGGVLVSAVWSLAASYVLPVALARFVTTGRIGAAFALRDVWGVAATSGYAVAWLFALAVTVGAGIVIGAVNVVPLLGLVAGAVVSFYASVVAFRLYGEGVAEATRTAPSPDSPASKPAA